MNRTELIKTRLMQAFTPSVLEVTNESEQHLGHQGYTDGESHFAIMIEAEELKNLSTIDAHRKVYALFQDLMPHAIHALRVKVIK